MAEITAPKIQIFGHSFVKRLREFIRGDCTQRYDLNLHGNAMVQYSGYSGATVSILRQRLEGVYDFNPDIAVLIIGTNDIYRPDISPRPVANSIADLVDTLWFVAQVQKVIVLQVLHRLSPSVYIRYPVDVDWFNARVDELNFHLMKKLNKQEHNRSYLWLMKGLWSPACKHQNFSSDGCHLSNAGQLRLINNIRAAVVAALKRSICNA